VPGTAVLTQAARLSDALVLTYPVAGKAFSLTVRRWQADSL